MATGSIIFPIREHKVEFFFRVFLLVSLVFVGGTNALGQDRCGTVQYLTNLRDRNLLPEDDRKFEQWLTRKISDSKSRLSTASTPLRIPVVIHVIHKGEAVGVGSNISDAQILSQIKVLNNDFRRLNSDTLETPTEFLSVAGKVNIEFVLAKQSPAGISTNGIVRVKGTKSQWAINDNTILKTLSYWPAEDYLNIWVTDIASTILGYAQFPVSDLAGLEDAETNRLTDGVVLDYRIIGSNDDGSFNLTSDFNKGRTATHEVGHFFGLRHIWGDDDGLCSGNGDYVSDTPDQGSNTNGCPAHPQTSCNAHTMFQNYMDYTNDVCMNLYTQQQINRMLTVIENSPRRASLLDSHGLEDPMPVANDLGVKEIQNPATYECIGPVAPTIVLENNGTNKITSARIRFTVNGNTIETKDFSFASLESQQSATVSFSSLDLASGNNLIQFEIVQTNLSNDGKSNDNEKEITTIVPDLITTPFSEEFNVLPQTWNVKNPDGENTWTIIQTAQVNGSSNKAMYMEFYNGDFEDGENDLITTPIIDLSTATSPYFSFDVAYAPYQNHSDGLEVYVLVNCNSELLQSAKIYSKYGSTLATAPATNFSFSPSSESQWRKEVINLNEFIGEQNVQLAFVSVSDNGNNLYLDNIAFREDISEDIAIVRLANPPVHCNSELKPSLLVENKSNVSISSLKVKYAVNGGSVMTMQQNLSISPGQQSTITIPSVVLREGENTLSFEIVEPNGFIDINPNDNIIQVKSIVTESKDKIPLRENFETDDWVSQWEIINPTGVPKWITTSTNFEQSLYFNGNPSDSSSQDHSWFVSPDLDFSDAVTASLFFDLSYRHRNGDSTRDGGGVFKVLASRDCGESFGEVLFSAGEISLASGSSEVEWIPLHSTDWMSKYINLNTLAGEKNVRIAFVLANNISNNIYIDNIEFFLSDNPSPFVPTELYTLYGNEIQGDKSFYISFNLDERQSVEYQLVDMLGREVGSRELSDVLNQTFKVDVENASKGIYLVRLLIDEKYYVSRIFVGQ